MLRLLSSLSPATRLSTSRSAKRPIIEVAPDEFVKGSESSQALGLLALGHPAPMAPCTFVLLPPLDDVARKVGEEVRVLVTNQRQAAENSPVQRSGRRGATKVDFEFTPAWYGDLAVTAGTYDFRIFNKCARGGKSIAHGMQAAYTRIVESGAYHVYFTLKASQTKTGKSDVFGFRVETTWPQHCCEPISPI